MIAGAATSERTAAVPAKAPGAARLSLTKDVRLQMDDADPDADLARKSFVGVFDKSISSRCVNFW